MHIESVLETLHALRADGKFEEAFEFSKEHLAGQAQYQSIIFQHKPIFWSNIKAGVCELTRRNAQDCEFVRQLWRDSDFIYRFHRHAPELPATDARLREILNAEYIATLAESKAIHWVVRCKHKKPWGLLSLTEISMAHQRAEVLLGVLPGAPMGLSTAAMLILFQFFFKAIHFNKLISYVYDDNAHSLKGTVHLGFQIEGVLKRHAMDPKTGSFVNLRQLGLLQENAFSPGNAVLMKRLLSR